GRIDPSGQVHDRVPVGREAGVPNLHGPYSSGRSRVRAATTGARMRGPGRRKTVRGEPEPA
ncbi:MAG: hypothetical protein WKF75_11660, partial [Singulisphaera sp.]